MPRYVIEREIGQIDEEEIQELGSLSREVAEERFPHIVWEHSHVCSDRSGGVRSFCVYSAPSEDELRAHANSVGRHVVANIYEIVGDVTPADFPSGR